MKPEMQTEIIPKVTTTTNAGMEQRKAAKRSPFSQKYLVINETVFTTTRKHT